jgi:DNA-nicking Smr family endonuclease
MKHGHRWGNGMAARRLGDGEQRLWFETMREVRPLRGRAPCTPPDDRPDGVGSAAAAAPPGPLAALALVSRPVPRPAPFRPPIEIGARQGGLDDTSWRMLGNGKLRPQRRLDLHGQRAQSAFLLLHAFLIRAQAERLRCVEIITGAGTGPEGGILRRELPLWLSRPDLRPLVLAAVHPHARNVGSVRLLLRRRAG